MSELGKKVDFAINLLKTASEEAKEKKSQHAEFQLLGGGVYSPSDKLEICYSTGKDSDVILHLARMAGIEHVPVYKATGIDPSFSVAHARENDAVVLKAKEPFFKLIEKRGFPTRRARFCCERLKEYGVHRVSVQGIRISESKARENRYKEPQICRLYSSKDRVEVFLPILTWTDGDVAEFIRSEGIRCHRQYYDEKGDFHVERRLGCVCCPLQSTKKLRNDFVKHPLMVKAYIRHGLVWWNSRPDTRSHRKFGGSLYNLFFHNVFCNSYEDYLYKTTGMFGKLDCKAFLEDYFKIDLP